MTTRTLRVALSAINKEMTANYKATAKLEDKLQTNDTAATRNAVLRRKGRQMDLIKASAEMRDALTVAKAAS